VPSLTGLPLGGEIRLGAFYDPGLLEDYGGAYFDHERAKLVQHDVRYKANQLIPPWEYYEALKPGTLVLILATLHCYIMQDDSGKDRKERKVGYPTEVNAAVAHPFALGLSD
jgi:hypothetical protein